MSYTQETATRCFPSPKISPKTSTVTLREAVALALLQRFELICEVISTASCLQDFSPKRCCVAFPSGCPLASFQKRVMRLDLNPSSSLGTPSSAFFSDLLCSLSSSKQTLRLQCSALTRTHTAALQILFSCPLLHLLILSPINSSSVFAKALRASVVPLTL